VNPNHIAAIVLLRSQMMRNQFRRSGTTNKVITILLLIAAGLSSLGSVVFAVGWGGFLLGRMQPFYVMYVWDGLVAAFLFAWSIGLLIELQRSELMSLKNLLHLPVSLSGAFFLNYTSSFASLTVVLFLPTMIGLCIASVFHYGAKSIVAFALLGAFLFMVTAVSYQLRGWLARLMENKRTRGTVITLTTIVFVLFFQIPNMINLGTLESRNKGPQERRDAYAKVLSDLEQQQKAGEITFEQYASSLKAAEKEFDEQKKADRQAELAWLNQTATYTNLALPIGWLPYGAGSAAGGSVAMPWLCFLGMFAIGSASLAMAYRSTVRSYTGEHNKEYRPIARKTKKAIAKDSLLERSVPFFTEPQSAITMATLRSTLRAPEAKMALLTPLILACVFGSLILTGKLEKLPQFTRPWLGIGAVGTSLMGMTQMLLNIFGLDRQGFRAFVLMPAARRDILLGKNMGILPIAGTLAALLVLFIGVAAGMHLSHVVASLLQIVIAYSLYFLIGNFTSIAAPIGLATGTMKPVSMKFSVIAIQMVAVFLIPIALIPAVVALATELLASEFGGITGIPIYLLLTLIEFPIAIFCYLNVLKMQGRYLQDREQHILAVISKVAD
jgi:ABC-2 type transport system permease protein